MQVKKEKKEEKGSHGSVCEIERRNLRSMISPNIIRLEVFPLMVRRRILMMIGLCNTILMAWLQREQEHLSPFAVVSSRKDVYGGTYCPWTAESKDARPYLIASFF